ncbi:MAG: hypothetical protein HGA67_00995 [Candidatus Yonathbacteria bacterium]|nr:hypothetical protein [Candidatus Yonathbacteria bacterium]
MSRKIFMSIAAIVFVGGLAAGATGAFFSDTEKTTGNTFTAGAIDLTVDSTQHYNNAVCVTNTDGAGTWQLANPNAGPTVPQYPVIGSPCDGTWASANLGAQKFFNFTDVKPGDQGEDTISLHVDSNDAYACVDVDITKDDDVSTVDPETDAGDAVENPANNFDGELAHNITFFAWLDFGATPGFQGKDTDPTEGDNIWQANEASLFKNVSGPASDVLGGKTYTLADSSTGVLAGNATSFIGLAWCAGTITTPEPGTILCDGADMGNNTQTDSMVATVAFRVEQARNNPNFVCTRPSTPPQVQSLTLENEDITTTPNWTPITGDGIQGTLTWQGDGPTFNYTLSAAGLPANAPYSLVYYADPFPGNNPGALIGTGTTNGSGVLSMAANPDLNLDLPTAPDTNIANHSGAKIWLIPSAHYDAVTKSVIWGSGPDNTWLLEGNVYINYDDTNN